MIYRMSDNEKLLFSMRLKELCMEKNLPEHGRQTILRKILNVSQEAVRKWLDGESVPRHSHKVKLCEYFKVNYEWLSTGRGQKYITSQKSNAEKILEMLGIDPEQDINNIDMEEVEIFRSTRLVPKENRHQLKKSLKLFLNQIAMEKNKAIANGKLIYLSEKCIKVCCFCKK